MSSEDLYTRCPTCKTVFRTHEAQLSVQSGKVRCGQCRMVFDGRAHLLDLTPTESSRSEEEYALGPPTITLRDSAALEPEYPEPASLPPAGGDDAETITPAAPARTAASAVDTTKAQPQPADEDVVPYGWQDEPPPRRRSVRWGLGIASLLLVVLFAGQAVFQFRHVIAANFPQWRPNLVDACGVLGCAVEPLRSRDEITIESHDLQADPAHQGLLILQITLRNRARHAVAFPYLELEILDLGGQPQVRRAFAPMEYAGGAADFTRGMPSGAEWNVKLFIDASSVSARGYNLDLFYP